MLETLFKAGQYPQEFIICLLLALVPTVAWYLVFGKKHRHRFSHVLMTFVAGIGAGAIILAYQYFWGERFDFLFFTVEPTDFSEKIEGHFGRTALSYLLIFLSVGFLEEYLKHWVVKKADTRVFESIDDVIELSIVAALGFAFIENVGYFFMLQLRSDHEGLVALFFVRSVFVVFVHILCSGIYGYFYGLGHFAGPVLQDLQRQGRKRIFPDFLHRLVHLRQVTVFRDEMATLGLLIAMTIHGLYDFFLEIETLGNLASSLTGKSFSFAWADVQLHVIVLPAMLVSGYLFLNHLLSRADYAKRYGHLEIKEEFVADERRCP